MTILPASEFTSGKPGLYGDVDAPIYHALDAASNSRLKEIERSPAHCKESIDNPSDPTPALIFGDALHLAVLQPELLDKRYVVADKCSAKTAKGTPCSNSGKWCIGGEWLCGIHAKADRYRAAFEAISAGLAEQGFICREVSAFGSRYFRHEDGRQARVADHKPNAKTLAWMLKHSVQDIRVDTPPYGNDDQRTVIGQDQFDHCRRAADAVRAHPAARDLLDLAGHRELSGLFEVDTPAGGVLCKMRLDIWIPEQRLIVDVKTTLDAGREEFERSIFKFSYYTQGAFYPYGMARLGVPVDQFLFICVEKEPPYGVAVYCLDDHIQKLGWEASERRLALYGQCRWADQWPCYPGKVQNIGLPVWAQRRIENHEPLDVFEGAAA